MIEKIVISIYSLAGLLFGCFSLSSQPFQAKAEKNSMFGPGCYKWFWERFRCAGFSARWRHNDKHWLN